MKGEKIISILLSCVIYGGIVQGLSVYGANNQLNVGSKESCLSQQINTYAESLQSESAIEFDFPNNEFENDNFIVILDKEISYY